MKSVKQIDEPNFKLKNKNYGNITIVKSNIYTEQVLRLRSNSLRIICLPKKLFS